MKAVCIKKGNWYVIQGPHENENWGPIFGEIVTIVEDDPRGYYRLAEYDTDPNGSPTLFGKKHFLFVSEIDETEMERNYQTEKV